jgi:hypothetical protein
VLSLESGLHSHVWTLGTIVSPAPKFMQICTLVDHDIRNNFSFGPHFSEFEKLRI